MKKLFLILSFVFALFYVRSAPAGTPVGDYWEFTWDASVEIYDQAPEILIRGDLDAYSEPVGNIFSQRDIDVLNDFLNVYYWQAGYQDNPWSENFDYTTGIYYFPLLQPEINTMDLSLFNELSMARDDDPVYAINYVHHLP